MSFRTYLRKKRERRDERDFDEAKNIVSKYSSDKLKKDFKLYKENVRNASYVIPVGILGIVSSMFGAKYIKTPIDTAIIGASAILGGSGLSYGICNLLENHELKKKYSDFNKSSRKVKKLVRTLIKDEIDSISPFESYMSVTV